MTATAHILKIARNGQPDLSADTIAIHAAAGCAVHGFYRNGGRYDLEPVKGSDVTRREIGARIRAAFPAASVKVTARRVIVAPNLGTVFVAAALEDMWQRMAAKGTSHAEMRIAMINAPVYREEMARVAS